MKTSFELLKLKRNDKGKITAILLHTYKYDYSQTGNERRYYNKYYIEKVIYIFSKKFYIPIMRFVAPSYYENKLGLVTSVDEVCIKYYWNVVDKWWRKLYGKL